MQRYRVVVRCLHHRHRYRYRHRYRHRHCHCRRTRRIRSRDVVLIIKSYENTFLA